MATPKQSKSAAPKVNAALEAAKALQANKFSQVYLEASLLATKDFDAIAELFEIPVGIVVEYEQSLYPVSTLSRLAKLELVGKVVDLQERELKNWAVTQGFDFVKWRLGFKVDISPVESMLSLYADCIFKSKEAFFTQNSDQSSKEALKWVRQATGIAQIIKTWVVDSKEAKKDIELALSKVVISDQTVGNLDMFEDDDEEEGEEENGV